MTTRIYTKTGDRGETGLFGGERVPKDHVRVEAYGTIDELNAALGQARSLAPPDELERLLERIQNLLFELGAAVATPPERRNTPASVSNDDVRWFEEQIDAIERELPPLKQFIVPGGTPLAAALHVTRTICRRAERRLVALRHIEPQSLEIPIVFLNRLGDFLFVLARHANRIAGRGDVPWRARPRKGTP